jgi:hypothetical protein
MSSIERDGVLSFPDDSLPPEGEFESRDALVKWINSWAISRGYAFITGRSTKEKTGRTTVTYMCDRARSPPDSTKLRQRKTTSRRTGCEFSILAKESRDRTSWALTHRPGEQFSVHNHEPSRHLSAHPAHRTIPEDDLNAITRLSNAGVAPRDIRTFMRQNSSTPATQQDIYNRLADIRRKAYEGQNTIHALANQLNEEGFWSQIQFTPDGRVTAVVFAHPESITHLQAYPDVVLLDCTYKTNKYGMPLLDIIGVDACQRSFCIAFAFLSNESEEDYLWALGRLKSLYENCHIQPPSVILTDRCLACMNAAEACFPSATLLLCLWHANKAVLRHCQPTFLRQGQGLEAWNTFFRSWHSIIQSEDEGIYYQRVRDFEKQYLPEYINEVGYIKTTWLDPYRERLVKAWVDRHLHFGNVVTSRVEGIHALLKSHLKRSTLDLFEAWRVIKHALDNQLAEIRSIHAKQQLRTPIELCGSLYSAVHGWVSHEALRKVEEQRKLLTREDPPLPPPCSGTVSRSLGLPCVHRLKAMIDGNQVLGLEHFHSHWHLARKNPTRILLEPHQRFDPVTSSSRLPQSSARREPSSFEAVEAETRPRALPRCSKCHTLGHTMSSKTCPLRYSGLLQQIITATEPPQDQQASVTEPALQDTTAECSAGSVLPRSQQSLVSVAARPRSVSLSSATSSISRLEYHDPRAIYRRYTAARDEWNKAQPPGSMKTNQQYRRAKGLPLRYDKASYKWCLDYKQMTQRCTLSTGSRDWTKEEMMAYLDWSRSEDSRVEAQVMLESGDNPMATGRRGMRDVWKRAERDIAEQQVLYHS